jgi:hypothetical protein
VDLVLDNCVYHFRGVGDWPLRTVLSHCLLDPVFLGDSQSDEVHATRASGACDFVRLRAAGHAATLSHAGTAKGARGCASHEWLVEALASFERKWIIGSVAAVGVSLLGWMAYSGSRSGLEKHLTTVGFTRVVFAKMIAEFSVAEVGWYVSLLLLSVGVLILFVKGTFIGSARESRVRAAWAFVGRGPWARKQALGQEVNYKEKYATNAMLDVLADEAATSIV